MQEEILKLVDFDKLRDANDLGKKWADRFGISINFYLHHMIELRRNYEKFKNQLEQKYRSQFAKDFKKLWYPLEVENILIRQYEPCINKICKKFCKDDSNLDEYLSLGMRTVRQSVWQYRTHKSKASFFTFVYNGLFQRIRGFRFKQLQALKKKGCVVFNESDLQSVDLKRGFDLSNQAQKQNPIVYEDEKALYENMVQQLIRGAILSNDEKVLINMYMNRHDEHPDWCQKFRDMYPKEDGSKVSRQGVHNKLHAIQKKMWIAYRRIQCAKTKSSIKFAI